MKAILALCALSLLTTGCTVFDRQERRINYTEELDVGPSSLITDAKQRVIINAEAKVGVGEVTYTETVDDKGRKKFQSHWTPGDNVVKNHPNRIICAEPSPDVAQAISAAFTAAAEVEMKKTQQSGDEEQARGAGNFGSSYASSVAQLGERLATVQLLRDKMYRACEAYQNGAISDTSYTLTLARFDKTMASMLAAEVAAGAFGRNLAALGGSASTSNADPKKIEEARKAVEAASDDLVTAGGIANAEEKTKATNKAKADLTNALADLASLAYQSGGTYAQSGPVGGGDSALGQIVGRLAVDADAVARINTNFLDDDATGTLVDACVVALDRNRRNISPAEKKELDQINSEVRSIIRSGSLNTLDSQNKSSELQTKLAEREALVQTLPQTLADHCAAWMTDAGLETSLLAKLQNTKKAIRQIEADMLLATATEKAAVKQAEAKQAETKRQMTAEVSNTCTAIVGKVPDADKYKSFVECVKLFIN